MVGSNWTTTPSPFTHSEVWWSRQKARLVYGDTDFDRAIVGIREKNPLLTVREFNDVQRWATVDGGLTLTSPLSTPVSNPCLIITAPIHPVDNVSELTYTFEVHFVQIKKGVLHDAHFEELLQSLNPRSD